MNEKFTNKTNQDNEFARKLHEVAEDTNANTHFIVELENSLRSARQPKASWSMPAFKKIAPAFGWVALVIVFGLALSWSIRNLIPKPQPAANIILTPTIFDNTPTYTVTPKVHATPVLQSDGNDWRGTKLYLSQPVPQSPAEANVYLLKSQPATMDDARALAQRFGINSEPQETPGEFPGKFDYLVTDGKQRLQIRSDYYFTYDSNFGKLTLEKPTEEQAHAVIDTFLKQHGFNFEYRFESAPEMKGQQYYILPLTPDGHEMRFDYMIPVRYEITLDNTGENMILSGYPMEYEQVGTFGIMTVDEAFQKVLDPNPQTGLMEISRGQSGGGGGSSFYKLNLSGTPMPFPSPSPLSNSTEEILGSGTSSQSITLPEQQLVQLEIGQRLESARGIFQVNIYETSQRIWYGFFETGMDKGNMPYMILEGDNLKRLQRYNNLPINIWGTVDHFDQNNRPVIKLEHYEIPFPEIKFQILEGTQKMIEIQGQEVLTFITSDGTQYVQTTSLSYPLDNKSIFGKEGDRLLLEALIVPDETFYSYPAIQTVRTTYAIDPISGQANKLTITGNNFNTYTDPPATTEVYIPPTAAIEKVDLVYYVRYPPYAITDLNAGIQYLQPAWRFYGHYSTGDEFEILVQALKQEFLLPEFAPYTPPG